MKDRAWQQIGSSGSGNHFVEFSVVTISDAQNELGLPIGEYIGAARAQRIGVPSRA